VNLFFQYGVFKAFPPGVGFGMFSPTHLGVLALLAAIIFVLVRAYRRGDDARQRRIRNAIAGCIIGLEVGKDILLLFTHQWVWTSLPLNMCSWAMLFVAWDAWGSKKLTREWLYALGLPGAFFALLTPDWVTSPILNIFVWQSFSIHMFIVAYVVARLATHQIVPDFRNLWLPALYLVVVVPPTIWVNHLIGANFFFLSTPVPGSPLAPISAIFGSWYLVGLFLMLLVFWFVMYLPWWLVGRRRQAMAVQVVSLSVEN